MRSLDEEASLDESYRGDCRPWHLVHARVLCTPSAVTTKLVVPRCIAAFKFVVLNMFFQSTHPPKVSIVGRSLGH